MTASEISAAKLSIQNEQRRQIRAINQTKQASLRRLAEAYTVSDTTNKVAFVIACGIFALIYMLMIASDCYAFFKYLSQPSTRYTRAPVSSHVTVFKRSQRINPSRASLSQVDDLEYD